MCEFLRGTVALPQRPCPRADPKAPQCISIEDSGLELDSANPGLITLTATLRNQAKIGLGYPALDLVLTDTKDHTVARRIFLPAEYLDPAKDVRAGMAPNADVTIRLDIDNSSLAAAGYRLDLLPAPRR